jgi:U3 small nucleolar RNA-associated protein 12
MLKTHHRQIVASKMMRPMLDGIRGHLRRALQRQKDEMGFNLAALKFIGNQVRDRGTREYVDEALWEEEEQISKGRKKRALLTCHNIYTEYT